MGNRDNYKWGSPDIVNLLMDFAKENRNNPTLAEDILWQCIRKESIGVRFRRQFPIEDFIVDFVCLRKKLVIEVDGEYHNEPEQRKDDERRTNILNRYGFYVLRFTNSAVINETEDVLKRIREILDKIEL